MLDTISCDQVFSVTSHRFFPDIPVSSTNKTDHQVITEQLLEVVLITNNTCPIFHVYFEKCIIKQYSISPIKKVMKIICNLSSNK